jgi:hypothetical protein
MESNPDRVLAGLVAGPFVGSALGCGVGGPGGRPGEPAFATTGFDPADTPG